MKDNPLLEQLEKIQAEQSASRERDSQIMSRLAMIETGLARMTHDQASHSSTGSAAPSTVGFPHDR